MSDILIRGMEMPKGRPVCIVIDAAGQARRYDLNNDRYAGDKLFEAVPVPPHGRLINADKLAQKVKEEAEKFVAMNAYDSGLRMGYRSAVTAINIAPTIIPASE